MTHDSWLMTHDSWLIDSFDSLILYTLSDLRQEFLKKILQDNRQDPMQSYKILQEFYGILKGHCQLKHMRISYHSLAGVADLHMKRHSRETDSEKHIRNIYTNLVKLN